jgi:hypothetical protein
MAKKVFLARSKEAAMRFRNLDECSKTFRKFNTTGRSLLVKFEAVPENTKTVKHLEQCVTSLTEYLIKHIPDRDLIGNTKKILKTYRIRFSD